MAHKEQFDFIEQVKARFPDMFVGKNVLECGSLNLNGSVRQFFTDCDYTGIDIIEGDGVDVVARAHKYCWNNKDTFDVVISCEMLEHDKYSYRSMLSMYDALKVGGLLVITCAYIGRPEHGTAKRSPADSPATNDYYANLSEKDFFDAYSGTQFTQMALEIDNNHKDIFFWGIKI